MRERLLGPLMDGANIDQTEIRKFDRRAGHWWDADGASKSLHDINPLRMAFITRHAALAGREVLDVGCGGGDPQRSHGP